jgi:hypothetical protein
VLCQLDFELTFAKVVNKSPAAIKAQSADDWVGIFEPTAIVNGKTKENGKHEHARAP